jgi:hypothetical protein
MWQYIHTNNSSYITRSRRGATENFLSRVVTWQAKTALNKTNELPLNSCVPRVVHQSKFMTPSGTLVPPSRVLARGVTVKQLSPCDPLLSTRRCDHALEGAHANRDEWMPYIRALAASRMWEGATDWGRKWRQSRVQQQQRDFLLERIHRLMQSSLNTHRQTR